MSFSVLMRSSCVYLIYKAIEGCSKLVEMVSGTIVFTQ